MSLGMSGKDAGLLSGNKFDVVVIGAGPAGSAVAITVARAGARVLMLDHGGDRAVKIGESLSPAANTVLETLGVSRQSLEANHLISCGVESSWGSPFLQSADFIRDPRGHGWHLDRLAFDAMLLRRASAIGVRMHRCTRVIRVERNSRAVWEITYRVGAESDTVSASWVADCSGRQSWFASQNDARRIHGDRLIAIFAFLGAAKLQQTEPVSMTTLIESVAHGWWYTAALPRGGRIVVYLTDADGEQVRRARAKAGFLSLLDETHHVATRVKNYPTNEIPLRVTRANSSRRDRCWGPGWVAAGDACLSFDPLSSQGIFNALYSGIKAGEALLHGMAGDFSLFPSYEKRLRNIYSIYFSRRNEFYSLERRWPCNRFWQRRTGEPAVA